MQDLGPLGLVLLVECGVLVEELVAREELAGDVLRRFALGLPAQLLSGVAADLGEQDRPAQRLVSRALQRRNVLSGAWRPSKHGQERLAQESFIARRHVEPPATVRPCTGPMTSPS